MISIAFINESTVISDIDAAGCVAALQQQVDDDFGPAWGMAAHLFAVNKGTAIQGAWQLVLLDDSDQADALGYHELTADGLPLGKIFAKSDLAAGSSWTVTASHELLEMLADPWINRAAEYDDAAGFAGFYACEVCDAVEADALGYKIGSIAVSDFVLPAWFTTGAPGPYSFRENVSAPFQLAPGGYIGVWEDPGEGWQQIVARETVPGVRGVMNDESVVTRFVRGGPKPHAGSRRERREVGRGAWRKSELKERQPHA